ncbi:MAG TPA: CDP-glycerol glycerophosphotransferase family protein, partial [Spirochaetota bacterium]|nr:CDP-glycerol glycerophosphotransferase family protein [Spirochaetota bacterium]
TGSMLFSMILGIVATSFFVLKSLIFKLVHLPALLTGKKLRVGNEYRIVFYSEGGAYWPVFEPALKELSKYDIPILYLTSDEKDPAFAAEIKNIFVQFAGKGMKAYFYLNRLEADIVVMTTPGLDVLQIKRSKKVRHYVHITHSAAGCIGYKTYGLDYYDTVLTGGDVDIINIKEIESKRPIKKKNLEAVGCTYLDVIREKLKSPEFAVRKYFSNDRQTVLISPTWGSHGLLSVCGDKVFQLLIEKTDYNIIVRPHPQSYVSEIEMIEFLKEKYTDNQRIYWDSDRSNLNSLAQSDIMISDFSGIIFDNLFIFGKPVISHVSGYDKRGKDTMDIDEDPWEIKVLRNIGSNINDGNIDSLPDMLKENLEKGGEMTSVIDTLRKDMDKYPGESGKRCAEYIFNLYKTMSK